MIRDATNSIVYFVSTRKVKGWQQVRYKLDQVGILGYPQVFPRPRDLS